ncbi:MAG: hypothetical protein QM784_39180 [Polyangiaceae bacterium]
MGRTVLRKVCMSIAFVGWIAGIAAPAQAQTATKNHLYLMVPLLSGYGFERRDPLPKDPLVDERTDSFQAMGLGIGYGRELLPYLRGEAYGAVIMGAKGPRGLLGMRLGPQLAVLDTRGEDQKGMLLRFVGLGGLAYRSKLYAWVHESDFLGQESLALTAMPALEGTYFSSPTFGWTLRAKTEVSYVVAQMGSGIWDDSGVHIWDAYRWGLTAGLDLGVTF